MKRTYYLFNPGILQRNNNTLKFTPLEEDENGISIREGQPRYIPVEGVSDFYVFGSLQANSTLYNFLGKKDIAVHFFDHYGNYSGSFMPKDYLLAGKVIICQVSHYKRTSKRLIIAKKFVDGATYNMLKNLQYYNRRGRDMVPLIENINKFVTKISSTTSISQLMGVEGNIRQFYYTAFDLILNDFKMGLRKKQPPENEVNALISFGNMMCYSICLRAINQTQLNPTISYLHEPGYRRYSLALDISEIFKPIIVDRVIFKLLNKKIIQAKHFDNNLNKCILNTQGKKIFVQAIEERLLETIKHRSLKRNVSYKHLIKLECYKLSKHILDIDDYKPFKMYW